MRSESPRGPERTALLGSRSPRGPKRTALLDQRANGCSAALSGPRPDDGRGIKRAAASVEVDYRVRIAFARARWGATTIAAPRRRRNRRSTPRCCAQAAAPVLPAVARWSLRWRGDRDRTASPDCSGERRGERRRDDTRARRTATRRWRSDRRTDTRPAERDPPRIRRSRRRSRVASLLSRHLS